MNVFRIVILIIFIVLHSCVNDESSPVDQTDEYFNLNWEVEIPTSLPQGIISDNINREYLYVASKSGGVLIFDKRSTPAELISTVPISNFGGHHAMHLTQQDHYLYVAVGDFFSGSAKAGIAIIDVSNPTDPITIDFWETNTIDKGSAIIIVEGNYAYLGAMNKGIYIFDITDKANIKLTDHYIPDPNFPTENPNSVQEPNARGMAISGDNLFVCYDAGGLRVIDVADKSNVTERSRYINKGFDKQHAYNNIILNGSYAYIATDYCGLEILDLSEIDNITLASWCNPWGCDTPENNWLNSAGHSNQLAYNSLNKVIALSTGGSEVSLIDVSDPEDCKYISSLGDRENGLATWGLTMHNNTIYATYITSIIPFQGNWRGIKSIEVIY